MTMVGAMASNFEDRAVNGLTKVSMRNLIGQVRQYNLERKFIKGWFASNKMEKISPFLTALEVPSRVFNGHIFIQENQKIREKLARLGFLEISVFCKKYPKLKPHLYLPKSLGDSLYNEEFQIEINLIPAEQWMALGIAVDIAEKVNLGPETDWRIFLLVYHRLLEQQSV
jgi:hypothetical protein